MTASYLGLAALDALLLGAGFGALHALGLVRSGRDALRHTGLALVVGWALVGIVESWALVAGAPLTRWVIAAICFSIAAVGVLVRPRIAPLRLRLVRESGLWRVPAFAGAGVVLVQLAAILPRAATQGAPLQWDAWAFWLPKARSIVEFGGLDTGVGGFTSFASPGYPPLVPALQASAFAFTGNTQASPLAVQEWLIAAAFFGAIWSLLAVRVRPAILWPCLALLASLPNFTALIGSSLGDEPLMLLLGLGCACAALWLREDNARFAALAALFLAAGALAKNEGIPPALVLGLTMLAVALTRSPKRALAPVLVILAPLAAFAPWLVWMHVHRLPASADYRLSDFLHPALLGDRLYRLSNAAHLLPAHIFSRQQWLVAVPLMLVAALLAAPRRPALSLLALAPVATVVAGLLAVYWIGHPTVAWYMSASADRVIASAVVMAVVFLPLLLGEAARRESAAVSVASTGDEGPDRLAVLPARWRRRRSAAA
ncbi:MAG: hypothetical protein QOG29_636 [Gaiellaceae bacterium]|nr:hypothetical protein [Gaiellaceae bacterium]